MPSEAGPLDSIRDTCEQPGDASNKCKAKWPRCSGKVEEHDFGEKELEEELLEVLKRRNFPK